MATKPMKTLKLPGLDDTYTFLQNDTTLTQSGKAADAKATGDALAAVQTQVDSVQTQVDSVQVGQELGAGQILTTTGTANPTPYTYRENASGSDRVTISQITGGTVAFNQLVDTATTSVTVASGHKYVALVGGTWSVGASDGTALTVTGGTDMVFDLTQMFGATVAQHFLDLETATPGAGVALFRAMFPESYYPYNAGELVSVQTSGRKTVGFNKWDGEYEADKWIANDGTYAIQTGHAGYNVTSYIPVIGGGRYYHSVTGSGRFLFYDSSKAPIPGTDWDRITGANAAAFTVPVGAAYMRATVKSEYLLSFIVNISDPARNGQYEPYSAQTYPLDSTLTLRGIPALTDGKVAYDGDKYAPDGTVTRRYGVRAYASGDESDTTVITDMTNTVYPLSAQTTETAAPYQEIQIAGSTEEFLPPATDTRAAAVPVGSVSLYQTNLRVGLETLLNTDLAHAESIAPVQGGTASANIASGELLMKDGKLYQATQAIVAGAEIGSTNTAETTLAAQLAALEARIAALEN